MHCLDIAAQMIQVPCATDLPPELAIRLRRASHLVEYAAGDGAALRSTQVIASIVEQWEREQES